MLGDQAETIRDEMLPARTREFAVVKRSVVIGGHKTSVSLEDVFWQSLREIAEQRGTTLSAVLDDIDAHRKNSNLSSHIRMFVLDYYRSRGMPRAG